MSSKNASKVSLSLSQSLEGSSKGRSVISIFQLANDHLHISP